MNTDEPIKVCQLVPPERTGGIAKHVTDLCNGLCEFAEVTVLACPELRPCFSERIQFIPINMSRSRNNPLLLWRLARIFRDKKFDIIHAHGSKGSRLLQRLKNWSSAKTVATNHNNKQKRALSFNGVSHVIAVSKGTQATLSSSVPSTVVYNGFSIAIKGVQSGQFLTKQHLCDRFALDSRLPLLSAIGRLVYAKGFDLLIEALHGLDANLLILGEGRERPRLQEQIRRNGQEARIKLIGHCDNVRSILENVDGVVVPSRNEGFSYVFAEALVLRKCVLSTDVPVANEILDPRLIMERTSESIRIHLRDFLSDYQHWNALMKPSYDFAEKNFSLESMINETLAVYRHVLNHPSANGNFPSTISR